MYITHRIKNDVFHKDFHKSHLTVCDDLKIDHVILETLELVLRFILQIVTV